MDLKRYSKLIVAIIGVIVIILGPDVLGITGNTSLVAEGIIALLTAAGVYQVPNAA